MSELRSFVGRRSGPLSARVTEEGLRKFCAAIGAPYRGEAPPTYMTVFRQGEFRIFDELGFSLSQVLHADQEYAYSGEILPGDLLRFETVLTKAFEKKGKTGTMRFLVYDTAFETERDGVRAVVGESKTTVIVRE